MILSCIQRDFSMRSRCSLSRNDIIIEIKHLSGTPFISCPDCNACLIHTPFTAPCLKHIKLKALRNNFYLLMPFRSSGVYPPSCCSCHSSSPLRKKQQIGHLSHAIICSLLLQHNNNRCPLPTEMCFSSLKLHVKGGLFEEKSQSGRRTKTLIRFEHIQLDL